MQKSFCGTSTVSTILPSGEVPLMTMPAFCECLSVIVIELIAVAVAFVDIGRFVGFESVRPFRNGAGIRAEAHGPALVAFSIAALHGLLRNRTIRSSGR